MGFSDIALSAFSTSRLKFELRHHLAEISRPIVERLQSCAFKEVGTKIALHGVQLCHAVRYGRSCGYTLSTQRTPIQSQSVEIPR